MVKPFTDFAGAFAHQTGREPFHARLVERGQGPARPGRAVRLRHRQRHHRRKLRLARVQPEAGDLGLVFDGNIQSLGGDYGFDESANRAVAVDSAAIVQALDRIYGATRLLDELGLAKKAAQRE